MVAVVSGNGLGLLNGSLSQLGQISSAAGVGQSRDHQYINTSNGNLVLQAADAALVFNGVSLSDLRTYNSEGTGLGQGWIWGFSRKVGGLTGTVNAAGSTIQRTAEDGSVLTYAYDTSTGVYRATAEAGARDALKWDTATSRWTWTNVDSRQTETYNATGVLVAANDALTGGSYTLAYTNGRLVTVTSGDGDVLSFGYDAQGRITSLSTKEVPAGGTTAVTRTSVVYGYDELGRLSSVTTSLESDSLSTAETFSSVYVYDGTSNRIARMTQGDGTTVAYGYTEGSDGIFRVTTITTGTGPDASTQTLDYVTDGQGRTSTTITDAGGRGWTYVSDASGRLVAIIEPAVDGVRQTTAYAYDANNNVTSITDALGNTTTFAYDAIGNRVFEQDAAGNTVTRTYNSNNQVVTQTTYRVATPGATPTASSTPETVRYVLENDRVRFVIDARGDVTENQYDNVGKLVTTRRFVGSKYAVGGLALTAVPTMTQMNNWVKARDLTQTLRTDYTYDLRGLMATSSQYGTVNSAGTGVSDASATVTRYVFDATGLLRQTAVVRSNGVDATTYAYDGMGRLVGSVSADGASTAWSYASDGSVTRITTDPTGAAASRVHTEFRDSRGNVIAVRDADTSGSQVRVTRYVYDANNRLRAVIQPDGAIDYSFYDAAGRMAMTVDAGGQVTEFNRDADGRVVTTIRYAASLDATGWLVDGVVVPVDVAAVRPAAGSLDQVNRVTFDVAGRVATRTDASGLVTTYTYDGESNLIKTVEGSGTLARTTRFFYDAAGNLQATLDADGYLTERMIDEAGRLSQSIRYYTPTPVARRAAGTLAQLRPAEAWNDETTTFYYDGQSRLIGTLDGESYFTRITYDEATRTTTTIRYAVSLDDRDDSAWSTLVSMTAGKSGQVTTSRTDAEGRIVSSTNAQGTETRSVYDAFGNLVSTTIAFGTTDARTQSTTYDVFGAPVTTTDGEGKITRYTYDAAGREVSRTDALGQATWTVYDALGRTRFVVRGMADAAGIPNASGEVVAYSYDAFGAIASTTAYANRLPLGSDGPGDLGAVAGALAVVADPVRDGQVSMRYDSAGRLVQSIDSLGVVTSYAYDAFGQLATTTRQRGANGTTRDTYSYDKRGNLLSVMEDADGIRRVTSRTFDAHGRVATETDGRGVVTIHEYDDLDREVSTTITVDGDSHETVRRFDAFGRVVASTDPLGHTTTISYSDADRTQTVVTPEGVTTVSAFNREGQLIAVTDGAGKATTYHYDREGRLIGGTDAAGGTTSQALDAAGHLLRTTDAAGRVVAYSYDAAGRVLSRTVDPDGLALTTRYTYDGRGQQVAVTDPTGVTTTYAYDSEGNLTLRTVDPAGLAIKTAYTYDAQGRQVTVVEASGSEAQTTTRFVYDALGRVSQRIIDDGRLNLATAYTYDGNDHVISSTDPAGATTWFAYDEEGQLIYRMDPAGAQGADLGRMTRFNYDADGVLVSTRALATLMSTTALAIATSGSPAEVRDTLFALYEANATSLDDVSYRVVDADGRLRFTVDASGAVVEYRYNSLGQMASTVTFHGTIQPGGDLLIALRDGRASIEDLTAALAEFGQSDATASVDSYYYDDVGRIRFTVSIDSVDGVNVGVVNEIRYNSAGDAVATLTHARVLTHAQMVAGVDTQSLAGWMAGDALAIEADHYLDAAGREVATRDASGATTFTFYDDDGRVAATVDATGGLARFAYDEAGRLIRRDAYFVPRDTQGWLVDNRVTMSLTDIDILSELPELSPATHTRFAYDDLGRLIEQRTPLDVGNTSSTPPDRVQYFTYDGASRVVTSTIASEPDGATSTRRSTVYFYDANGRVTATVSPLGYVTEAVYDASGEITKTIAYATSALMRDADGIPLPFGLNLDAVRPSPSAQDQVSWTFRDAEGRVVASVDAEGYVTQFVRDILGQIVSTQRYVDRLPVGTTMTATGVADAMASRSFRATTTVFDALGRVLTETDEAGTVTAYTYDNRGHATSTVTAVGTDDVRGVSARYDALGHLVATTDGLGRVTTYTYDPQGNLASTTDPLGNTVWRISDGNGRVLYTLRGVAGPDGTPNARAEVMASRYDGLGELVHTTTYAARLDMTSLGALDAAAVGAAVSLIENSPNYEPGPGVSSDHDIYYRYDDAGNLIGVRSGRSVQMYGYNGMGDLVYSVNPGGHTASCGYGSDSVNVTYYQYDEDGRRISAYEGVDVRDEGEQTIITDPVEFFDSWYGVWDDQTRAYNGDAAQVTLSEVDAFGNVVRTTDGRGVITECAYDHLNQRTSTTHVMYTGNATTATAYDAFHRIVSTTDAMGAVTSYAYSDATRTMTVRSPEGVILATAYNREGQIIAVRDASGLGTVYQYDAAGQLVTTVDRAGGRQTATFDAAGNVTEQVDADGRVVRYSYDAAGRVLTRILDPDGLALATTYRYDGQGHVMLETDPTGSVTAYGYDFDGNRTVVVRDFGDDTHLNATTWYVYDPAGHVVAVTQRGRYYTPERTYDYDAMGRLVAEHGVVERQYGYDQSGNLSLEFNGDHNQTLHVYDDGNREIFTIALMWGGESLDATVTKRTFDGDGRLRTLTVFDQRWPDYQYAYNLMKVDWWNGHWSDRVDWTMASILSATPYLEIGSKEESYFYDPDGRQIMSVVDGRVTESRYDSLGRVRQTIAYDVLLQIDGHPTEPTLAQVRSALARNGSTEATSRSTVNYYDEAGRLRFTVKLGPQGGHVAETTYTPSGAVVATRVYDAPVPLSALGSESTTESLATQLAGRTYQGTRAFYDGAGRKTYEVDAAGVVREWRYDGAGRTTWTLTWAHPVSVTAATTADSLRSLVASANPSNGDATGSGTAYDALGRVAATFRAYGSTPASVYTYFRNDGRPGTRTDADGTVTTYDYDDSGNVSRETVHAVPVSSYDAHGVLTTKTSDIVTTYGYDGENRKISASIESNAGSTVTYYQYDYAGHLTVVETNGTQTGENDSTTVAIRTEATFDELGRKTSETDANGSVVFFIYSDGSDRPRYTIDGGGYVTGYTYNGHGEPIEITRFATSVGVDWSTTQTGYQAGFDRPVVSPDDRTITIAYDVYGNKVEVRQSEISYTKADGTEAHGTPITRYTYDTFGRETSAMVLVSGTPGVDAIWSTSYSYYDASGNKTAAVDASGYLTTWAYDSSGHVLRQMQFARALDPATITVGGSGPAAPVAGDSVTGPDRLTTYTYTAEGQVATETTMHTVADGHGGTTAQALSVSYGYDRMGRVVSLTTNGRTVTTSYDPMGRVVRVTGPQERVLVGDWQARLAADGSLTLDSASLYVTSSEVTTYGYDEQGNRTTETHSNTATGAFATTYYRYDAAGREIARVMPADGRTLDWSSSRVQRQSWDAQGNLLTSVYQLTENDGHAVTVTTTNSYDAQGRLLTTTTSRSDEANPDVSRGNVYDAFGEVISSGTAETTGEVVATYDNAGRLVRGTDPKTGVVHTYTYDLVGNVLTDSYPGADGASTVTLRYVHDRDGRVTQQTVMTSTGPATLTNTFDRWGNVLSASDARGAVTTYRYDESDHVISESGPVVEVVDEHGVATSTGPITRTFYDLDGNVVARLDANGHGTGSVFDAMGRVVSVTDGAGATRTYAYDAMGNQVAEQDGLHYVTFRNYDSAGHVVQQGDFTTVNGQRQMSWRQAYVLDEAGNRIRVYDGTGSAFLQAGNLAAADRHASWYGFDSQGRVLWSQSIAQHAASLSDAGSTGASGWTTALFNPRFDQGSTGWTAAGGFQFPGGSAIYNSATEQSGDIVNNDRVPVDVGQVITASASIQVTGQGRGSVFLVWYDAAGQVIAQSSDSNGVTSGAGTSSVTGTAPTGAVAVAMGVNAANGADTNNQISIQSVNWQYTPPAWAVSDNGGVVVTLPTGSFTMQPTNGDFENGSGGWASGPGWTIVRGYDYGPNGQGTGGAARLNNTGGARPEMLNTNRVPVQPGQQITARAMVQQGASDSGDAGAQVFIIWLDKDGNRVQTDPGNMVDSGSGGKWHSSDVTGTAPPNAVFAQVGVAGYNNSGDPLYVDAVQWNYQFLVPREPRLVRTEYVYDVHGNRVGEKTAEGDVQSWTYDAFGHVTAHTDLSGATYHYIYNEQTGQLVHQDDNWSSPATSVPSWITGPINTANSSDRTYYANGLVKTITYADGSAYSYEYDANGNVTREESITHDAINTSVHVVTQTTYDSHDRISHVVTSNLSAGTQLLDLYYRYDGVGNRREIRGTSGNTTQDAWYTYDGDNRVLVSAGTLKNGSIEVTSGLSYALSYDAAGNAKTRMTMASGHHMLAVSEYDDRGQLVRSRYAVDLDAGGANRGVQETRTYNENGQVLSVIQFYAIGAHLDGHSTGKTNADGEEIVTTGKDIGGFLANATFDRYDAFGRLLEEQNFGHPSNWTGTNGSDQVPAGTPAPDAKSFGSLSLQSEVLYQGPHGAPGYDATGNIVFYQMIKATGQTDQYTVTYLKKDAYLEAATSGQNVSGTTNVIPSTDQSIYDRRGDRVAIVQHTLYAGGSTVTDTLRAFAYNGNGQIISRRDGTNKDGKFDQGSSPATQNQHYMYVGGEQVGHTDENGKLDILSQVTAFSSGPASGYVVQQGDTLKSIAQTVYGNASLWYIIAQANAIDSDAGLAIGQDLTIPEIKTNQNDASTFKPYNPGDIAGSTTPSLPTIAPPPPPPSRPHCNVVAAIIVIAVVVVATILTAGAALGATSFASAFVTGASAVAGVGTISAATIGAAALGGFVGSAAGQLVGNALGVHEGFSFGEALTSGLTTAATAGLGSYVQGNSALATLKNGQPVLNAGGSAVMAAGQYVAGSAAAELTGQEHHFSWAGLVASTASAAVTHALGGTPVGEQARGSGNGNFFGKVASGAINGGVTRELGEVLGDRHVQSWDSVASSAVGTAVASTIISAVTRAPSYGDDDSFGTVNGVDASVNRMLAGESARLSADIEMSTEASLRGYFAASDMPAAGQLDSLFGGYGSASTGTTYVGSAQGYSLASLTGVTGSSTGPVAAPSAPRSLALTPSMIDPAGSPFMGYYDPGHGDTSQIRMFDTREHLFEPLNEATHNVLDEYFGSAQAPRNIERLDVTDRGIWIGGSGVPLLPGYVVTPADTGISWDSTPPSLMDRAITSIEHGLATATGGVVGLAASVIKLPRQLATTAYSIATLPTKGAFWAFDKAAGGRDPVFRAGAADFTHTMQVGSAIAEDPGYFARTAAQGYVQDWKSAISQSGSGDNYERLVGAFRVGDKVGEAVQFALPFAGEVGGAVKVVSRGGAAADAFLARGASMVTDVDAWIAPNSILESAIPRSASAVLTSSMSGSAASETTAAKLGDILATHSMMEPGPLNSSIGSTFAGGRYLVVKLREDATLYRAGTLDQPLGQFFDTEPLRGVLQARVDKAILPVWPGGGKSPVDTLFKVRIPKGTTIYVGEVGSQGGIYVGGTQQIVVREPWNIHGVDVLDKEPLR